MKGMRRGVQRAPRQGGWWRGVGGTGKARSLPSTDIRLDQSRPTGASSAWGT